VVENDFGSALSAMGAAAPGSGAAFDGTLAADAALASTAPACESQPAQENPIAAVVIATAQYE
jgi:hypothetical protein